MRPGSDTVVVFAEQQRFVVVGVLLRRSPQQRLLLLGCDGHNLWSWIKQMHYRRVTQRV